jgi:hypothetical protein
MLLLHENVQMRVRTGPMQSPGYNMLVPDSKTKELRISSVQTTQKPEQS